MAAVSAALERPLADREDWLRVTCGDDSQLFSEALRIVRQEEEMGSFLLHPMLAISDVPGPFRPREVILERFEIVREIGHGSMGVVYEAFDRKRGLRIAIKAAKPGFQRLLSPELEGALTVRHPNVCLVNEIHTVHAGVGEIDFITMELLEGATLSGYLEQTGKLPEAEAIVIARQLCAGLAEAHRSGIIHRDLKSANIILCGSPAGERRAVITDFGLSGTAHEAGDLRGTFPYIAPELWEGQPGSKESDIYALGIVLYEMVADPELKAISDDEDSWAPNTQGLSSHWAETLKRCTTASPSDRPRDAADVVKILEKRPSQWRYLLAIPLLAAIALCFPQARTWAHDRIWPPPNVRLAILPPRTANSSLDLAGGILQDVSNRISHLTSGARLVEVISPADARNIHAETAKQATEVHATHAFETSIKQEANDVLLSGSLIDLKTGATLREISARYPPPIIGAIPSAIAGTISVGLGLQGKLDSERISPAATAPYDRGLQFMAQRDPGKAVAPFQQASALDPRSPLPLAGLVQAEAQIFDASQDAALFAKAQNDLQQAESLNPDSVSVHFAAGILYEQHGEFEKARQQYARANQLEPKNIKPLLGIANTYADLDMPDQAFAAYRTAINLDPAFYQPYEYLGGFYYNRGDYSRAAEQYSKVTQLAPKEYLAYAYLAAALRRIGKYPEAAQSLLTSLSIHETSAGLNNMGSLLASQKRDAEAIRYYDRAVASNPYEYRFLLNSGDSHLRLGDVREAKVQYRKGMGLALTEFTGNPRAAYARACYAYFAARLGDKKRAQDEILQAMNSSNNDTQVVELAVITYVVLGLTDRAFNVMYAATPQLLRELEREPNLASFSQDSRFKKLVASSNKGEK